MSSFKGIPFNKPFIAGRELSYIARAVLAEGHLAGDGTFTRSSQAWLERRLNCPKALLTHSCTAALEMAALLFDIGPGDEVIMPSFTFVSTANAFALRGATPVFVDIREDTLNIDENLLESALSSLTRAVVPVHYAGRACAMDRIMELAEKHGFWVIEDAAQALLSSWGEKYLGTIGHLGCLSFHETKNIICGEGGALLINDSRLIQKAEIIREKGTDRSGFLRGEVDKYTWQDIGSSFLPSELNAAFLYAQLEEAEVILDRRRRLYARYHSRLRPLSEAGYLRIPELESHDMANGHLFYVLANSGQDRDRLIEHLRKNKIYAVFHYIPLHSSPAGQRLGRTCGSMEVTDRVSACLVRLPLYYDMSEEDVDFVVKKIQKFY
jgi:dTDP-4-amino-4,6-dideoxygalactose transaminase